MGVGEGDEHFSVEDRWVRWSKQQGGACDVAGKMGRGQAIMKGFGS